MHDNLEAKLMFVNEIRKECDNTNHRNIQLEINPTYLEQKIKSTRKRSELGHTLVEQLRNFLQIRI